MQMQEVKPKSYPTNLINKDWNKRKCHFLAGGQAFLDKVHDLKLRDDDVWIVTLPKCGTTWMQELVWLVMNDFDFQKAKTMGQEKRSPFMEFNYMTNENIYTAMEPIEKLKSPRFIKSHLELPLLPAELWNGKHKLIYVFRNPKDAWISFYYHMRSLGMFLDNTLEEYLNIYMNHMYRNESPFDHATEFYELRNKPWIFYTSFERMKSNLREVIEGICVFLNKEITDEQMEQMLQHLSFENMKNNPQTQHDWEFNQIRRKLKMPCEITNFVRKGKVGAYKEELSPETIERLNSFIEQELKPYNVTLNELLLLKNTDQI